ncbi:prepilin-type N-terminal cleavage/methylation domain-containing protein [Vibrio cincinnatiensis]|uniref:prepilin-type N-terminal cleavage/methylation domain-containing protein n=1 Tax=Vibrio cincinnatiensis TaxID=675 RepID=UPI001EDCBF4A|nr:prepilin-type N-terminal cleavage/methylation domain-containing protein [Vibrio cincinnatiensis]MCG3748172.1 prepilin-type N-terminal cleavage/methylation domain-containing protein [Vibrio cincinnatiensis]
MSKKQSGFSLVELVIVIVVVGLLAVAALPRFLDVADEAKKASIEGVAGGFATGVLSARAQWEAKARPSVSAGGQKYNTVDYDGVEFWLTHSKDSSGAETGFRDGYPVALNNGGSFPTSMTDQQCVDLMENLLQNPPQVAAAGGNSNDNLRYTAQANGSDWICTYIQQEGNSAHQFVYELKTGRVTVTLN